jgi:hypothetical protein
METAACILRIFCADVDAAVGHLFEEMTGCDSVKKVAGVNSSA